MKRNPLIIIIGIAALVLPGCAALQSPELQQAATRIGMEAIEEGLAAYQRHLLEQYLEANTEPEGGRK